MNIEKSAQTYGAAVTICAVNYLPKALVLEESFSKNHNDFDFYILIMGKKDTGLIEKYPHINFLWVEELGIDKFEEYAFIFDIIELSTNVKPTILQKLIQRYQIVMYIDPDIYIYDRLLPVLEALEENNIVITPHSCTPVYDGKSPNDVDFSRFGSYNLGFIGLRQIQETEKFLKWWSERCLTLGFYEPQSGLAVDQKWIDLVPSFFSGVAILRNVGLNAAFWNLHERNFTVKDNKILVNESTPLYFFHYSSFNTESPLSIAGKQDRFSYDSRSDIKEMLLNYASELSKHRNLQLSNQTYCFDYFDSGEYIPPVLRRIFSVLRNDLNELHPFRSQSKIYKYAKKCKIIGKHIQPENRATFKDISQHTKSERLFSVFLRLLFRMFGPQKYFLLMRYFSFISSIRNQKAVFEKLK